MQTKHLPAKKNLSFKLDLPCSASTCSVWHVSIRNNDKWKCNTCHKIYLLNCYSQILHLSWVLSESEIMTLLHYWILWPKSHLTRLEIRPKMIESHLSNPAQASATCQALQVKYPLAMMPCMATDHYSIDWRLLQMLKYLCCQHFSFWDL